MANEKIQRRINYFIVGSVIVEINILTNDDETSKRMGSTHSQNDFS